MLADGVYQNAGEKSHDDRRERNNQSGPPAKEDDKRGKPVPIEPRNRDQKCTGRTPAAPCTIERQGGRDPRAATERGQKSHTAASAFAPSTLLRRVRATEDDGGAVVSVMDPIAALGVVGNEKLAPIAAEARERLERVIRKLSQL
jgi:hypothetical protein